MIQHNDAVTSSGMIDSSFGHLEAVEKAVNTTVIYNHLMKLILPQPPALPFSIHPPHALRLSHLSQSFVISDPATPFCPALTPFSHYLTFPAYQLICFHFPSSVLHIYQPISSHSWPDCQQCSCLYFPAICTWTLAWSVPDLPVPTFPGH